METIKKLEEQGRVERLSYKPHIVNPLSVAVQRNKNRMNLDCSFLNKYVIVPNFKYENEKVALDYFRKGCYMIGWDLRDGYHHVLIHPEFRDYLGFKVTINGQTVYFRYIVGPFGLKETYLSYSQKSFEF